MRITYLGHAGFCVETSQATVIMDPWLSPTGAFDAAWFQFPRNHHLRDLIEERLRAPGRQHFVYISHEHKDHFDLPLLRSLESRDFTLVIGRFQRRALQLALAEYACNGLRVCEDGEQIPIPGGYLKVYLDDSGLNRDSGILVAADGHTFLNLNDCKMYDRLADVVNEEGKIDVFTCQFSGATWHPTCYTYPQEQYERISRKKMLGKFESVVQAIKTVNPRVYLPSAGPACFLDPELLHINFENVNIFPRSPKFIDYLNRRLPNTSTSWFDIAPGDVLDVASGELLSTSDERVDEEHFREYLQRYAAEYAEYFEQLRCAPDGTSSEDVLDRLRLALLRKLERFGLRSRMHSSLYFGLTDQPDQWLEVDFKAGTVERAAAVSGPRYYSISAPAWQVRRILDGQITWEDFSLTFRARLERAPDLYQTIVQAFLILEAEDLDWFCSRLLDLEERGERTVVEVGGRRYSIARFCPHQGGDLKMGRPGDPGCWVCPRHGWQFDLDNGGACTTNETTIDAVALEED